MGRRTVAWGLALLLGSAVCGCAKSTDPDTPGNDTTGASWEQVADFGGPAIRGSVAFGIGGSAYVVSGFLNGDSLVPAVWRYDTTGNRWARVADFPGTPRLDGCGFAVGGKGYVALGSDNATGLSDVWEYDPASDHWTRKGDFPGGPLMLATAVVIAGRAYVIAGLSSVGPTREVWEYDPTGDAWTHKAAFPGSDRAAATGFAVGDRGYVGLGYGSGGFQDFLHDFWEYDPQTDHWTPRADYPAAARGYALGLALGTRGFVTQGILAVGPGGTSLVVSNDLWEYSPTGNAWTRRTDLPASGRAMAVAFVIGGAGYVGLGSDWNLVDLRDVWRLTPR